MQIFIHTATHAIVPGTMRHRRGRKRRNILYYRTCVFEIIPSKLQGMCLVAYFSMLYQPLGLVSLELRKGLKVGRKNKANLF